MFRRSARIRSRSRILILQRLDVLLCGPSLVELVCVPPPDVEKVWPLVEPMLRKAIERTGLNDFADIESALFTGSQLLWMAVSEGHIEAAVTTQLVKAGDVKACIIVACSGEESGRWLHLIGGIEKYAKDEGASRVRIYGRKGWERVLDGYRVEHVIMEKNL